MRPAEKQASDLLATVWERDEQGAPRIPVDPFMIAESLGLMVMVGRLEPDVSGMLLKEPGQDAKIFVNASDSDVRRRFSCAHEIGHYVLRARQAQDAFAYIDRRSELASQGTNPSEIYANQFAAELLMPEEVVRRWAGQVSDTALAARFRVSVEAMRYRLQNLAIAR